jgi:cobalt transporter subunit CbtB
MPCGAAAGRYYCGRSLLGRGSVLGWRTKENEMSTLIRSVALPDARREATRYGIAAILLGVLFIGVTGFAPLQALHDAAHNTRHAISFPCH